MGKEIERKFLVSGEGYKAIAEKIITIKQGYLNRDPQRTVRVRISDDRGKLTVKGLNHGIERLEFEYDIPVDDALELLTLCEGAIIDKTRWIIRGQDGHIWEIDEFHGDLHPLVVAEIELTDPQETFVLPNFLGEEVTGDPRYYNSSL